MQTNETRIEKSNNACAKGRALEIMIGGRHYMKLTVLGSGTNVPYARRGPSGYAILTEQTTILLDGGSGTVGRMAKADVDFRAVSGLFYTHSHVDHTGDLVPFLYALNYTPDYKRTETLPIFGPPRFREFVGRVEAAWPDMTSKDYALDITEMNGDPFTFRDMTVRTCETRHSESTPSVAYRFSTDDSSIVYSGDTMYTENLVELARDADLLVVEASFPLDSQKMGVHLSAGEAGKIAAQAGVQAVLLTHMYPICDEYDMREICAGEYSGPVFIAEDLKTYSI
jgi:ribonuclease BN (tRNA processing enzyme)